MGKPAHSSGMGLILLVSWLVFIPRSTLVKNCYLIFISVATVLCNFGGGISILQLSTFQNYFTVVKHRGEFEGYEQCFIDVNLNSITKIK